MSSPVEDESYSLLNDDRHIVEHLLGISDLHNRLQPQYYDALNGTNDGLAEWVPANNLSHKKRSGEAAVQSTLQKSDNNGRKFSFSPAEITMFDWRSVVEPDTFRYVVDNGSYNNVKTRYRTSQKREVTRNGFMRMTRQLTYQQKSLQKVIKNDLKKELTHRRGTHFKSHSQSEMDLTKPKFRESPTKLDLDASIAASLEALDLPNILSHSFAEKIVENFASKIASIEDEIRRDFQNKIKRRQTEPIDKTNQIYKDVELLNSGRLVSRKKKHNPRLDTIAQETFTVKSMQPSHSQSTNLRPLTKVTPQQRMIDENNKILLTQIRYASSVLSHSIVHGRQDEHIPLCTYAWTKDAIALNMQEIDSEKNQKLQKFSKLEDTFLTRAITKITPKQRTIAHQHEPKIKIKKSGSIQSSNICGPVTSSIALEYNPGKNSVHTRKVSIPEHHSVAGMYLPKLAGKRLEMEASSHRIT